MRGFAATILSVQNLVCAVLRDTR